MREWKWDRSCQGFIEIVQWAFVFHRVYIDQPKKLHEIMSNPDLVDEWAEKYGMTYEAVSKEMIKYGKDYLETIGYWNLLL